VEIAALLAETYAMRCEPPVKGAPGHTGTDFMRIARSAVAHYQPSETMIDDARIAVTADPSGEWDDSDQTVSVNARDFMLDEEDLQTWLVDGVLQASSLNQLVGGPKAGKSTFARHLSVAAAYGLPFLGRFATKPTRVLYYSLQENRKHLRAWLGRALRTLDTGGIDVDTIPIDFVFRLGRRGAPAIKGLLARCKKRQYGLVVLDMFGRFAGLRSLDDYAEVETLCDGLKDVADQTGACILWLHHERKAKDFGDPFQGTLGSQAIRGAVYTTIRLSRERGKFYLATEQRDGDDIADTALVLDEQANTMRAAGSKLSATLADEATWRNKVVEMGMQHPALTADEVKGTLGGSKAQIAELLRGIRTPNTQSTKGD
jgi:RecA-family ATPase